MLKWFFSLGKKKKGIFRLSFKKRSYQGDVNKMQEALRIAGRKTREIMHREQGGRLF